MKRPRKKAKTLNDDLLVFGAVRCSSLCTRRFSAKNIKVLIIPKKAEFFLVEGKFNLRNFYFFMKGRFE